MFIIRFLARVKLFFIFCFQTSEKFFPVTFIGAICWIAFFSYLMVWWAHQVCDKRTHDTHESFYDTMDTFSILCDFGALTVLTRDYGG